MGIFKDDRATDVSSLIMLWVVEGILKPISGKGLEEIAEDNLKDLVDRNLIFINEWGWNAKYCNMHDLLRDLCLRQSQNEKFFGVASQNDDEIPKGISNQRRVVVRQGTCHQTIKSLPHMPLVCSLIYDSHDGDLPLIDLRLLRILTASEGNIDSRIAKFLDSFEVIFSQLINSIYEPWIPHIRSIPSSLYSLWNVHTLAVKHHDIFIAPLEIWKMPQLQHVEFSLLELADPHMDDQRDDIVLWNLQTLFKIRNFKCSEEVVKKSQISRYDGIEEWSLSCFDNLQLL